MNEQVILMGVLDGTYICTQDGYAYFLGPQADSRKNWQDAITWCKTLGPDYELPNKEVLKQCYDKQELRSQFTAATYWSSSEYSSTSSWFQDFNIGIQFNTYKYTTFYVRAVRRLPV